MEPDELTESNHQRWILWLMTNVVIPVSQPCLVFLWLKHEYPTRSGGDGLGYGISVIIYEAISIPTALLVILILNFWACRSNGNRETGVYAASVLGSTFIALLIMGLGFLALIGF